MIVLLKWVTVWDRVPLLEEFSKVFEDKYHEVSRLFRAYGILSSSNTKVYSLGGVKLFDESSLMLWDVSEEDWNDVFKPLLTDYGFTKEAEYFEKFVGRDDIHWIARVESTRKEATSSVTASYNRPLVYLVKGVGCNEKDIFNLIEKRVLTPTIEYAVTEGYPPIVRYLFRVNRTNRKLFPCGGVKPGTIVVANLGLI